ncbi:hypothetical protein GCM10009527_027740 [Actinomadura nitritigenes]|uniref:SHOCT domain-containing protein n=1 Tax=Actinomadura nitritigenes TaxID=134602 RepID=A0ABS3RCP1_9ACTN|nr:SHOCT domain-containing protein [Actinomadura nitritigenes]MBO2443998.1 SHOCT domain-containing protein [Actinomadura nitritigenes]
MMFWNSDHMNGWSYGFMAVGMVLFWGLLIFGIVMLVRFLGSSPSRTQTPPAQPPHPSASGEQILAERYARGEINAEEHQERLDVLRGTARPAINRKPPSDRPPPTTL